ncbi:DUF4350 domain-containing protein [Psychromicrobium xiongbiense]|uniref:DUF4350 domain-containing protein n=1 Tax=Psychromicrobium xiongbiense TaxID=3051184 RepID=UPI002555EBFD|nr:DUF4350 domain-containing protein [Psychromicrobium sp. YIM S02556]
MNAVAPGPTGYAGGAVEPLDPVQPPRTGWLKRQRLRIFLGLAAALLIGIGLVSALSGQGPRGVLDAQNPAPEGGMAVAHILQQQGVTVTATSTLAETIKDVSSAPRGRTTVLLFQRDIALTSSQLRELAASGARLVLITPGPLAVQALSPELQAAGVMGNPTGSPPAGPLTAQCTMPDAQAAGTITSLHPQLYTGPTVCFPGPGTGAGVVAQNAGGTVTAVGSPEILMNRYLDQEGNAALALRLLGHTDRLLWYIPGPGDLPESQHPVSPASLLPPWVAFVSPWLLLVGVLACLWKGRRHGPVVEEPLPVVVKASETAIGRARLYQNARALDRTVASLRTGSLRRLARRYRLPSSASAQEVIAAVTLAAPARESEIRALLSEEPPHSQAAMVSWSQRLDTLERQLEKES